MALFGRFTEKAQKAIILSQEEAKKLGHNYVGTEHLLLGIMAEDTGVGSEAIKEYDLTLDELRQEVAEIVGSSAEVDEIVGFTPRTKRIFELSLLQARELGHNYIGTEHLLLGLLAEGEGVATMVLKRLGVDTNELIKIIIKMITDGNVDSNQKIDPNENDSTPTLEKYGQDLNKLAKEGKIDPVIGRDKEIERVIQILSRRTKNNPVLIGEPGVGKTAIAEGLAQKIVEGNIPEIVKNKKIISLDLAGMIAGAKYRGEFEERFKSVLDELKAAEDTIVFIDELHTIVGAGAAEGAVDASNMLKPMLARGDIQMIGATTIDEYRKHIEKDAAFERRLQTIMVEEPSVEDTIKILKGLRDKYEAHHGVQIEDEAIKAAAELSYRYISDRFLPDKAIDLIDEAASKLRVSNYIAPDELKEIEEKLDIVNKEKESAVNNQDYEKAAEMRDEEKRLKDELNKTKLEWKKKKESSNMIVNYEEIAKVVSDWTNVPVSRMTEEESNRLLNLESILHEKVIGQSQAVKSISNAIRRARVGLKDSNKPIGSFIFVGPTGVGKTYLAKSLTEALFGDEDDMIRIDMSEYMEKHSVSRLIGSPPGYVGYDDGGQLTEAVRRNPYSVVLFDEIEKAHPDVFNVLLQILDDGRLTDSKGRTVDFKNTVLIMTSNVGATSLNKKNVLGFSVSEDEETMEEYEMMKETINEELKRTFRPEFLNRLDETIVFHPLEEKHVKEIVDLMIDDLEKKLKKLDVNVKVNEDVRDKVSKKGFDKEYGARPLERTIRKLIEDQLAEEILKGNVSKEDNIIIKLKDDKLVFEKGQ